MKQSLRLARSFALAALGAALGAFLSHVSLTFFVGYWLLILGLIDESESARTFPTVALVMHAIAGLVYGALLHVAIKPLSRRPWIQSRRIWLLGSALFWCAIAWLTADYSASWSTPQGIRTMLPFLPVALWLAVASVLIVVCWRNGVTRATSHSGFWCARRSARTRV